MPELKTVRIDRLPLGIQRDVARAIMGPSAGCSPVRRVWGTDRVRKVTYQVRGGTQCIRRMNPRPRDPKRPEQLLLRQQWRQAVGLWAALTHEQADAWRAYARRHFKALGIAPGARTGFNLFVRAQAMRLRRGVAPALDAPALAPPRGAYALQQLPSDSPTTFRFKLDHLQRDLTGMHLLVEVTPATPGPTRAPRETDLRYIRGVSEASFIAMQESGATYEVADAQFAVNPGERYALRVRIVSAECLASRGVMREFVKEEGSDDVAGSSAPQSESIAFALQSGFAAGHRSGPSMECDSWRSSCAGTPATAGAEEMRARMVTGYASRASRTLSRNCAFTLRLCSWHRNANLPAAQPLWSANAKLSLCPRSIAQHCIILCRLALHGSIQPTFRRKRLMSAAQGKSLLTVRAIAGGVP